MDEFQERVEPWRFLNRTSRGPRDSNKELTEALAGNSLGSLNFLGGRARKSACTAMVKNRDLFCGRGVCFSGSKMHRTRFESQVVGHQNNIQSGNARKNLFKGSGVKGFLRAARKRKCASRK